MKNVWNLVRQRERERGRVIDLRNIQSPNKAALRLEVFIADPLEDLVQLIKYYNEKTTSRRKIAAIKVLHHSPLGNGGRSLSPIERQSGVETLEGEDLSYASL